MWGATIIPRSLKTTRNEKKFKDRPKNFFFFKSYMTLKYLLIIDFSKIRSIKSGRDGFKWKSRAKMSKSIPLSLRLSGIKFSIV
jgi:hypothetical protein